MKKWLIGSGIVGAVVLALLAGLLMTSVFAQGPTPAVPAQSGMTAEEAKAAALAANPGTQVVSVDQDSKDGTAVYEVTLDNGLQVQVDANSGAILGTDQEEGSSDVDNVQEEAGAQDQDGGQDGDGDQDQVEEEFESQADDASELPDVEDAPGQ
jgi:peptidase YpeB-like protein